MIKCSNFSALRFKVFDSRISLEIHKVIYYDHKICGEGAFTGKECKLSRKKWRLEGKKHC